MTIPLFPNGSFVILFLPNTKLPLPPTPLKPFCLLLKGNGLSWPFPVGVPCFRLGSIEKDVTMFKAEFLKQSLVARSILIFIFIPALSLQIFTINFKMWYLSIDFLGWGIFSTYLMQMTVSLLLDNLIGGARGNAPFECGRNNTLHSKSRGLSEGLIRLAKMELYWNPIVLQTRKYWWLDPKPVCPDRKLNGTERRCSCGLTWEKGFSQLPFGCNIVSSCVNWSPAISLALNRWVEQVVVKCFHPHWERYFVSPCVILAEEVTPVSPTIAGYTRIYEKGEKNINRSGDGLNWGSQGMLNTAAKA